MPKSVIVVCGEYVVQKCMVCGHERVLKRPESGGRVGRCSACRSAMSMPYADDKRHIFQTPLVFYPLPELAAPPVPQEKP